MNDRNVWMLFGVVTLACEAGAQQYIYPAKGQSPEQQKRDESA